MKLAQYVADFIASVSPRVYGVVGAGAMHLNDAICHHAGIEFISMHHEQAAAFAAEADARVTNKLSVLHVTAGPGGTNAMTGVASAYVDSIPMLVIAGQVTTATLNRNWGLRQFGTNELDMADLMRKVTKLSLTVDNPNRIRMFLEMAVHEAMSGRRSPVFLEIPLNVQAADIDPLTLPRFERYGRYPDFTIDPEQMVRAVDLLKKARRPLIIAGNGIRMAGAEKKFSSMLDLWGIPTVTSWNAVDLFEWDELLFIGRPGVMGDRAGNFAVQNADLILALGTRLSFPQTGHDQRGFAPHAKKIIVDIDATELCKPVASGALCINADVGCFIDRLYEAGDDEDIPVWGEWRQRCHDWKGDYPVMRPEYRDASKGVNSYAFIEELSKHLPDDAIVVTDAGTAFVGTMQSLKIKSGQRLMYSSGLSPMGWGLPAAVGAAKAGNGRPVVCICGDGGIMMNLQELATIAHHNLPVKIFVLCNDGYLTMRQTQNTHFARESSASPNSGVGLPDFGEVAFAFGLRPMMIAGGLNVSHLISDILSRSEPVLCEVFMPREQILAPRLQTRLNDKGEFILPAFDDLWPHLPPDELARARSDVSALEAAE